MLEELPTLSLTQYLLVYNLFFFTTAAMGAAFVFFVMSQKTVAPQYRIAVMIAALVVFVSAGQYWHLLDRWEHVYALNHSIGMYEPTGDLFTDVYRFAGWLLTVPLLLLEFVLVLNLSDEKVRAFGWKLAVAAVLMIALGYPGAASSNVEFFGWRGLWGFFATLPFLYILHVLFIGLQPSVENHSADVSSLLKNARLLLLASWGYFPIAYMVPMMYGTQYPSATPATVTGLQTGYAIADVFAKTGFGLVVYQIARRQSAEGDFEAATSARSAQR